MKKCNFLHTKGAFCHMSLSNTNFSREEINEILNKLVYKLKLRPIEPPHLLPYYYGRTKKSRRTQ